MRGLVLAVVASLGLGGCFVSSYEIVPSYAAVPIFYDGQTLYEYDQDGYDTGDYLTFTQSGSDYYLTGNHNAAGGTLRAADVGNGLYVLQLYNNGEYAFALVESHEGHWDYYQPRCEALTAEERTLFNLYYESDGTCAVASWEQLNQLIDYYDAYDLLLLSAIWEP